MMSEASKSFATQSNAEQKPASRIDSYSLSTRSNGSLKKRRVNPFNLKECDAGYPQENGDNGLSTMRTEMSTDLEDCSVHQKFSFTSQSMYTTNRGPSVSYASSFESNIARFPTSTGHRTANIDVIATTGSCELISQLTGPKSTCLDAYENSLLDLDEDDACDSPQHCSSWGESEFIGANDANDTESRINFYSVPEATKDGVGTKAVRARLQTMQSTGSMFIASDGALETESHIGFYKQQQPISRMTTSNRSISVSTDARDDFNLVNDTEEPPSCRDKIGPVLSFTDEDEFDWLTQTTMKIEAKKRGEKIQSAIKCGEGGAGIALNLRSFVSRCGGCFSPPA